MGEFTWFNIGVINNVNKKVKIGVRNKAASELQRKMQGKPLYMNNTEIVNYKTRFVEFFPNKMLLLDSNLRVYELKPIGDDTQQYCYLMYSKKCVHCKRKITFADGMFICEKCDQVKGEYI